MGYDLIHEVPVWGPADEGAVRQIRTCLADNQAAAGALTPIGVAMAGEDEFDPYKD